MNHKKGTRLVDRETSKMGRPEKYKPEFCEQIIEHSKQGLSIESFGGVVGVSKRTIYTWCETHEDFLHACQEASEHSRLFWEKMGVQGAKGELVGFKDRAWIFNMKNRFAWKDRLEHSGEIKSPRGDAFANLMKDPAMMEKAMEVAEFLAEQEEGDEE